MMPRELTKTLGPGTTQRRGLGTTWLVDDGGFAATNALSQRIVTHGSASRTRLLIDLDHDLLIVIARADFGPSADKYEERLLKTIADALVAD